MISIKRIMFYESGRGREAVHEREDAADASQALDARKARSSAPADGPVATVRNAGPGRHPCGIARDKVDGPVAVVSNGGGTKAA